MNAQKNITVEKFYRVLQWCAHGISYFIFSLVLLLILLLGSILNKELNRIVFTQNFIIVYYLVLGLIFIIIRVVFYLLKRKHTYINLDTVTAENISYKAFRLFRLPFYSLIIFVILLFSYFIFANTSAEAIKDFYEKRLELTNLYSSQVEEFNREGVVVDYENLSSDTIELLPGLTDEQQEKLTEMLATKKKIDEIDTLTKELEKTLSNSMDNYRLIEKRLEKIKQQIADKDNALAEQNYSLEIKIKELAEIIKKLNENPGMLKNERDTLMKKREAIEEEIIKIKEHIGNLEREKTSLELDRSKLESTLQNIIKSTPLPSGQPARNTYPPLPPVINTPPLNTASPQAENTNQYYDKAFIAELFNIMILKIEMSSNEKIHIMRGDSTEVRNSLTSVKSISEIFVYGSTDIKLMDQIGVIEILDAQNRIIFIKTKRVTTDYNVTGSNFNFSFVLELNNEEQNKLDDNSVLAVSITDHKHMRFPVNMHSTQVIVQDSKIKLNLKRYLGL